MAFVLCVLALLAVPPRRAEAHPLGNFTTNRWARIEPYRDLVRVTYVLDLAEIPTFQEMGAIDTDNNGASAEELQVWAMRRAEELLPGLVLALDGRPAPLGIVDASGSTAVGQANLPTLRFIATYEADLPPGTREGGRVTVSFRDGNYLERLGWREIVIASSTGARIEATGHNDRTLMLTSYPASSLTGAPDEREVTFSWFAGTGTTASPAQFDAARSVVATIPGFEGLIGREPSMITFVLSALAAAGFGMVHALGPGHGKAVVAAFLIGSRGTPKHAVALGLTVTATHTATVYALGGVTLIASAFVLPDRLYVWLSIASGLLVIAFGLGLSWGRWRAEPTPANEHAHAHPHVHTHPHPHDAHDPHSHDPQRVTWRSVLTLGVIGGVLPCPSAIVVMLAAISLGQVMYGLLLIVAFSAGLAGVLTALGLAVVIGHRVTSSLPAGVGAFAARAQRVALLGSPLVLTAIGVMLTTQAVLQATRL